jgi:hypothetical protein
MDAQDHQVTATKSPKAREPDQVELADEVPPEDRFATFEDLCEGARYVDKFYPQIGGKVSFRTYIPLDKLLQMQARHGMLGGRGRRDSKGFLVAVLKEVLINPRVDTQDKERLLLKSHASVLLDILGEVLGTQEETFRTVVQDLGEA